MDSLQSIVLYGNWRIINWNSDATINRKTVYREYGGTGMQDEDYMRQLSFGNDSALDTLVFRYHKPLYGYVYRLLTG